jgi:hypothetical protein
MAVIKKLQTELELNVFLNVQKSASRGRAQAAQFSALCAQPEVLHCGKMKYL